MGNSWHRESRLGFSLDETVYSSRYMSFKLNARGKSCNQLYMCFVVNFLKSEVKLVLMLMGSL